MSIKISERALNIKPSQTLEFFRQSQEMISRGIEVINFGVGEPDFGTPEHIKAAAVTALKDNFTRYTIAPGILELRQAIVKKLERDNHISYTPEEILVTPGAKTAIALILATICDPGDEVLIPAPYWVSYPEQVRLVKACPVIIPTDESTGFELQAETLEAQLKQLKKPTALILNSPNNPTGAVYHQEALQEIVRVCREYNVLVIADEVYEKLIYDGAVHYSVASLDETARDMCVMVNGVSKAYAMTGWRLGYVAAPRPIIRKATQLLGHTLSCVNSIAQKAAIVALTDQHDSVEKMRRAFARRKDFLFEFLQSIEHIQCFPPRGAFYAFPDITYYLKYNNRNIHTSMELCQYLLAEMHIAVVPGAAFGVDGHLRFSYSNSMPNLKQGLQRFKEGLLQLKR